MRLSRRLSALLAAALLGVACQGSARPPAAGSGSTTGSGTGGGSNDAGGGGAGGSEPEVPYCNRGPNTLTCNPYGLSLDRAGMSDATYWDLLGGVFDVHFYRPETLYLDQFESDPTSCPGCDAGVAQGYYLVLVVRDNGGPTTPTAPPADLALYQGALGKVLDHYQGALAAVVIEHEADLPTSYAGTPEQYLAQLQAGCAVAHQKGVRCTDSGVSSTSLLLWLARYYAQNGNAAEARRILTTAENNPELPAIFTAGQASEADALAYLAAQQPRIDRAEALLGGHRAAGVDSANFHWYEPSETTLDEILAMVRTRTGCYRLMTDELGQRSDAAAEAGLKLVLTRELGLPLIVWRSADGDGARSLVDPTGALRPSGERFAQLSTAATCGD